MDKSSDTKSKKEKVSQMDLTMLLEICPWETQQTKTYHTRGQKPLKSGRMKQRLPFGLVQAGCHYPSGEPHQGWNTGEGKHTHLVKFQYQVGTKVKKP